MAPDGSAERLPTVGLVLAGGVGSRVGGDVPKQLLSIAGRTVLAHTLAAFEESPDVDAMVVVMAADFLTTAESIVAAEGFRKVTAVLPGGATRHDSARRALDALGPDDCNVLFHDAARPLLTPALIGACVTALRDAEAIVVAIPTSDTVLEIEDGVVTGVPDRTLLQRAQTPQGFRLSTVRRAYELAADDTALAATDNCGVVRRHLPNVEIRVVAGSEDNIKITSAADLALAEALLQRRRGAG